MIPNVVKKLWRLKYERTWTYNDMKFLPLNLFPCKVNSLQVKRNLKSSMANFVYKLPHELPNLRLRILGK